MSGPSVSRGRQGPFPFSQRDSPVRDRGPRVRIHLPRAASLLRTCWWAPAKSAPLAGRRLICPGRRRAIIVVQPGQAEVGSTSKTWGVTRDRWFESGFLPGRVCEPSVPRRRSTGFLAPFHHRARLAPSNPHRRPSAHRFPVRSFFGGFPTPAPYTASIARAGPASETLHDSGRSHDDK